MWELPDYWEGEKGIRLLIYAHLAHLAHPLLPVVAVKIKTYVPALIACRKLSDAFLAAAAAGAPAPAATTLRSGLLLALDLTRTVMALSVEARDLFDAMKVSERCGTRLCLSPLCFSLPRTTV